MLLCLKCFSVYRSKLLETKVCRNKNCVSELVEIDELLIPTIIELNRKNYVTKFCCSGHFDDEIHRNYIDCYINFEDNIVLPNLPQHYMYDTEMFPHIDWSKIETHITIRRQFVGSSIEICQQLIKNAFNLLEWSKSLPVHKQLVK